METPPQTFVRAKALRHGMSRSEIHLWLCLRGGALNGLKFRKQHPIGPYILDFYCSAARLAVELDGPSHDDDQAIKHDAARDAWLGRQGVKTLRIKVGAMLVDLEAELALIERVARARIAEIAASASSRGSWSLHRPPRKSPTQ